MQHDPSTPRKRIFTTPRGTAELDIAGTGRQAFVTLTVFDDEGWAAEEDMWWSGHGEDLAELLASLTGMSPSEGDAQVDDFMSTWKRRGGPAQAAAMTHRFGYGVVGVLLAVAGGSGLATWAFGGRGGPAQAAAMTHRFGYGVVGVTDEDAGGQRAGAILRQWTTRSASSLGDRSRCGNVSCRGRCTRSAP